MSVNEQTELAPVRTEPLLLFPEERGTLSMLRSGGARDGEQPVGAAPGQAGGFIDLSAVGEFVKKATQPRKKVEVKPHKICSSLIARQQPSFNLPVVSTARSVVNDQLRAVDVSTMNRILRTLRDPREAFWRSVNSRRQFTDDLSGLNQLIARLKPLNVFPHERPSSEELIVSALISIAVEGERTEEPNTPGSQTMAEAGVMRSAVTTFTPAHTFNQIDQLKELLQKSRKLQDAMKSAGAGKYVDREFPPNDASILGFKTPRQISVNLADIRWLRPEQFLAGRKISVYETIDPNDIMQGSLGDCYFLAACSSIAEYAPRLQRNFLTDKVVPQGVFIFALCVDGIWQDVLLDEMVPCAVQNGQPAFNRTKNGELWVILAEKAWAKVYGGYFNIAAGLTREALRDLTGACCKTFFTTQLRDDADLWNRLREADANKWIMTAGSDDLNNNGTDAVFEKVGIAGSHAYALLAAQEVETPQGRVRLLRLRNPWGKTEWNGRWSDNDSIWNSALIKQVDFLRADDGCFYMQWEDFVKYFSDVQICYYHDDYSYTAVQLGLARTPYYLTVNIYEEGLYYFSLNQPNRRRYRPGQGYNYSLHGFVAARVDPQSGACEYLGSTLKADKENWIAVNLKPGPVTVLIQPQWNSANGTVPPVAFSVYGPRCAYIESVQPAAVPRDFITRAFTAHARGDRERPMKPMAESGLEGLSHKKWDNQQGFGYIYFENAHPTNQADIALDFGGSENIALLPPFTGTAPAFAVPPGRSVVVCYKATFQSYTATSRFTATFKPAAIDLNEIDVVKRSGTPYRKSRKLGDADAPLYLLSTPNSFFMLIENPSATMTLSEQMQFALDNTRIQGQIGDHVEVSVPPRSSKLIKLVRENPAAPFRVSLKNYAYKAFLA